MVVNIERFLGVCPPYVVSLKLSLVSGQPPMYRGALLIKTNLPVGPYSVPIPTVLRSYGDPRGLGVSYERGTLVSLQWPASTTLLP